MVGRYCFAKGNKLDSSLSVSRKMAVMVILLHLQLYFLVQYGVAVQFWLLMPLIDPGLISGTKIKFVVSCCKS